MAGLLWLALGPAGLLWLAGLALGPAGLLGLIVLIGLGLALGPAGLLGLIVLIGLGLAGLERVCACSRTSILHIGHLTLLLNQP